MLRGESAVGGEASEDGRGVGDLGGLGDLGALGGGELRLRHGQALLIHGLTHLLEVMGPWLVFGLVFLESMGLPFPGETVLLTGAAFAAAGKLSIVEVYLGSALGGLGGGLAGYAIGRSGVLAWLRRRGATGGRVAESLGRAHAFFERHGGKSLLIGRFIALVRSFVFIAAGAAGMRLLPFAVWDAVGATLWSAVFAALGYEFGHNLPRLEHAVGAAGLALAGALALGLVLALLIRWTWQNQERIWEATSAAWERLVRPRLQRFAAAHPRTWRFGAARLSPGGYLGLHLTLGILVSLLALWLFGGVLEDVVAGDPLTQFDRALAAQLHVRATPGGIAFFRAVSDLGSPVAWSAISLLVAVVLLVRRRRLLAAGWIAAILGGGLLDLALKLVVARPRPLFAVAFVQAAGWSFPSGHSMGALVGYGMLAYLLGLHARRWVRAATIVGAAVLIGLIGFSRLYLGAHYFSDVIGGYAAGVVWLSACVTGLEVARRRRAFKEAVQAGAQSAKSA